ncbi:hypothetical protein NPX13_g5407 [Xylaria arbuscula]|uniref:Uncharacterized protein n=1 Tax=Xylaria arbuscula TaxID=114810 RepID=A0A9W8NDQ4_9PEZI|nr:hypothetical protein NPX13_g5407 [Xylaria arbuscula]
MGFSRLNGFSSYTPSLTDSLRSETATQPTETLPEMGNSSDSVQNSRFSLSPSAIDLVYPTPGSTAEHTILPHITFKDSTLPWSWTPSHIPKNDDKDSPLSSSKSTWLALMVFAFDELQLSKDKITEIMSNMSADLLREQTETCSLQMRARDTVGLSGVNGVVNTTGFSSESDAQVAAERTGVVLLTGKLFADLFVESGGPTDRLHVGGYKHLAHVRQITTDGAANAGSDEEAHVSNVISRRCGPMEASKPSTIIVHLLSLCWDPDMPFPKPTDRVAVTTLYSWTYTCLASSNKSSTADMLADINILRTDQAQEHRLPNVQDEDAVSRLIANRQRCGYTLARHRTVTGEETAAIHRGPLVSTQVEYPLNMRMQSNFGGDLAILDSELGLLDITYASAWQLGKTLAMADSAFCASLTKLRNSLQGMGLERARGGVHDALGRYSSTTRREATDRIADLVKDLDELRPPFRGDGTASSTNRWNRGNGKREADDNSNISSIDFLSQDSPHFAQVYSWVLDRVHLSNIPAHYLIPDPALLPQETLRFFYLDLNWTDALIDGALSLANHWAATSEKDSSRTAIKEAINKRLREPDTEMGGWHVPLPRYGFLLRSHLLEQFPDLTVDVKCAESPSQNVGRRGLWKPEVVTPVNTPGQHQPVLVQKRIAPDTIYVLFDVAPPDLHCITITTSSRHQQCFRLGPILDSNVLTTMFKKIYTSKGAGDTLRKVNFRPNGKTDDGRDAPVFNWETRLFDPAVFSQFLMQELRPGIDGCLGDDESTSTVLARQLNESILQLEIGELNVKSTSNVTHS